MARAEKKLGQAGEQWAMAAVRGLGVEMVEGIGTPVKIIGTKVIHGRKWHQIVFGEKVSGDTRGVLPGGRSVLVETKTIMDRSLRWGDLRPHQPERLSQHAALGGWSLLVWVHSSGIYILEWPISDFRHGKSITPERAQNLHVGV
jgi:hypothetical protein